MEKLVGEDYEDTAFVGIYASHLFLERNQEPPALDDLPVELKPRIEKWATEYDTAHAIAHWEEDGIKLPPDYEQVLEMAAQTAQGLLADAGTGLAPALLEFYPAVAWEDRDECLEVLPEEIDA